MTDYTQSRTDRQTHISIDMLTVLFNNGRVVVYFVNCLNGMTNKTSL